MSPSPSSPVIWCVHQTFVTFFAVASTLESTLSPSITVFFHEVNHCTRRGDPFRRISVSLDSSEDAFTSFTPIPRTGHLRWLGQCRYLVLPIQELCFLPGRIVILPAVVEIILTTFTICSPLALLAHDTQTVIPAQGNGRGGNARERQGRPRWGRCCIVVHMAPLIRLIECPNQPPVSVTAILPR